MPEIDREAEKRWSNDDGGDDDDHDDDAVDKRSGQFSDGVKVRPVGRSVGRCAIHGHACGARANGRTAQSSISPLHFCDDTLTHSVGGEAHVNKKKARSLF